MSIAELTGFITMLAALSVASERLVEIVKGFVPWLNTQRQNETTEGWRCAILQVLAVLAGIVTAALARDYLPAQVPRPITPWTIAAIGLLASGGSGLWNSVLGYVLQVKKLKQAEVEDKETPDAIKADKSAQKVKEYQAAQLRIKKEPEVRP